MFLETWINGLMCLYEIMRSVVLSTPPYLGLFKILSRAKKYFKLGINGHTEIVYVDRLKKAHFEYDTTDLDVIVTTNFNPLQSPLHTPTPLYYLPTLPLGQDMTQGQFLSGV